MSKEYREVAKKLGVHYLFGRWGVNFYRQAPDGPKHFCVRFWPLDGWKFASHEIVEAIAGDPDMKISYEKEETP